MVVATGGIAGPVAGGVDERLADLPQGENSDHDDDHGPAYRQSGAKPRDGGPDPPSQTGIPGPATTGRVVMPPRGSPRRSGAESRCCHPWPPAGACEDGGKTRPGPAEERLAADEDQPRQSRELSANQRHPPLEPRLCDSLLDLRQAVAGRLNRIQCRMQHTAECVVVVAIWSCHAPRSRPLSAPLALLMSASP